MTKGERKQQVGRLAFRHKGNMWNAYWALPGTMEGALFLGSVRMAFVVGNAEAKEAFMSLMRRGVDPILREKTGGKPIWPGPVAAPEHERSGHG